MKIVIIGANGQVGKELCTILSDWGHDLTAIVRNPFGAAFFELNDYSYILSDIVNDSAADAALAEADIAIIAAVARGTYEEALTINSKITDAVTAKVSRGSAVVFFSSIRIFSRQIDRAQRWHDPQTAYDREKMASEKYFLQACEKAGAKARVFRLGHVIGFNQAKNKKFLDALKKSTTLAVEGNKPSNVIHTLSIADAITTSTSDPQNEITATLVNSPQWTWQELFKFVAPDHEITFTGDTPRSSEFSSKAVLRTLLRLLGPFKKWLKSQKKHLKGALGYSVYLEGRRKEIQQEMGELTDRTINLSEFEYSEAPGPYYKDLKATRSLVEKS